MNSLYKNLVCLIFFLTAFCLAGIAQLKGFGIGPYLELGAPAGDFRITNGNAVGAGLSADIRLPGSFSLTGAAGYLRFRAGDAHASDGTSHEPVAAFPLRAGLKYKPLPLLYLKMESGTVKYTGGKGASLILSPGIGIRLLGLDIQGSYESWLGEEGRSFWGLRAGYQF